MAEFKTGIRQISVASSCFFAEKTFMAVRTHGVVTIGAAVFLEPDSMATLDVPRFDLLQSMEYCYEPVDMCFNPVVAAEWSVLSKDGTLNVWDICSGNQVYS